MKVSELWLREWVNPALTGPEIAAQLTMAGLEVDGLNPVAGVFDHVIVAKVLRTTPHPQADKLTLCEVDTGSGAVIHVVCGAANVRSGLVVALALPGANLPGDFTIKESVIRGQPSQGMLCSGSELGMDDHSDGIMELADDAPIGADFRQYLQLDDHVLDIDLTPNRADCFSVLGVAREIAALNKLPLQYAPTKVNPAVINDVLSIELKAQEACPQYCGRIIRSINPHAVTPLWIKERLRRSGLRSLNAVVDVTNYVMLELGQPMHAFDLQTIGGQINVRYARKDEELKLLDGKTINLNDNVLVIADDNNVLAMAGIMGGEVSGVQDHTTDIFLESAFFNPLTIAGTARRFGLCSDSSQRFERGVDPTLQVIAMDRATELLHSIVGGQVGPISIVKKEELLPTKVSLLFNPKKVKKLTGMDIPEDEMIGILRALGMAILSDNEEWIVDVPAHRFDISQDVDLVEEIIRLYGYDNLKPSALTTSIQAGKINPYERIQSHIAYFLSGRGYSETISYSFVDPSLQQEIYPNTRSMQLINPISPELSEMRIGMWPGLIASMVYNAHRQQSAIKFFEAGVVFNVQENELQEQQRVAGLIMGELGGLNWSESARIYDFYDIKGDLQALFDSLNLSNVRFVRGTHPALHPGQTAQILIGEKEIGWVGVMHPRLVDELGLNHEVMLFELSLESLIDIAPARYQKISKYPQIRRDLSLLVNTTVSAQQIEQAVRDSMINNWLKAFDIFDVYTGNTIPADKKSLAIALTLQADDRTLVDAEINTIISAILKKLDDEFAITLRASTDEDN